MKKIIYLLVFAIILSCDENQVDCSTVNCQAPQIIVNLIDNDSKENFILLNMLDKENISVQNSSEVEIGFLIEENTGLLIIEKSNTSDTIEIQIAPDISLIISYDTSTPKTDACCDFGELKDVQIQNNTFNVSKNTIIIEI